MYLKSSVKVLFHFSTDPSFWQLIQEAFNLKFFCFCFFAVCFFVFLLFCVCVCVFLRVKIFTGPIKNLIFFKERLLTLIALGWGARGGGGRVLEFCCIKTIMKYIRNSQNNT